VSQKGTRIIFNPFLGPPSCAEIAEQKKKVKKERKRKKKKKGKRGKESGRGRCEPERALYSFFFPLQYTFAYKVRVRTRREKKWGGGRKENIVKRGGNRERNRIAYYEK